MKVVYFGTPSFAASILKELIAHKIEIVAVVTKPDRPKGRSLKYLPSEVKSVALQFLPNVPIHQPEKCSTPDFAKILKNLHADIFVVVGYGEILKEEILSIPQHGCINVHASLLPSLRGAAPIQRALIAGMKDTGVTIIKLVQKMDAGDVIISEKLPLDLSTTYPQLEEMLCNAGARVLLKALSQYEKNEVKFTPQDHTLATFAPKVTTEECQIDWKKPAFEIHNLIRAVTPHPGAFCYISVNSEIKRLKILQSEYVPEVGGSLKPSSLINTPNKKELLVACGQGAIRCLVLQLEGKRDLEVSQFLLGVNRENLDFTVEKS